MILSDQINCDEFNCDGLILSHGGFNINWLTELGVKPDVIFDIGSYDAGDSVRFKKAFPDSEVYSFEACPKRAFKIKKFIKRFGVNFYDIAVSEVNGTVDFYSSTLANDIGSTHEFEGDYGGQGSLFQHSKIYKELYPHINQEETPRRVKSVRVDSFCNKHQIEKIDLAHIDVEGAEINVIKGFGEMRPKVVYVETILGGNGWINGTKIEEMHSLLMSMGYELIRDFKSDRIYFIK